MQVIDKQTLRGFGGKIIGYLESDKEGNQQIRDFYGRILGRYDKNLNCTRDFYGKKVSEGNTIMGFLSYK